ncbi:MAG: hypothetical protein KJS87_04875 [Alphaproteobacteria bacterium]|nr:hypothetical protein [Alphaproteobacteria bacterium]
MTRDATLRLLAALLADLPQAIETGDQLIRLINRAYAELKDMKRDVTAEDIDALLKKIRATSARIQSLG